MVWFGLASALSFCLLEHGLIEVDVREELVEVLHEGFRRWTIGPDITRKRLTAQ
jgi:hypothetical protein